jgi:hypothetical protein
MRTPNKDAATAVLPATNGVVEPVVVIAVGRRDVPTRLAEPLATREAADRDRLPIDALLLTSS